MGRLAEDGRINDRYPLTETPSSDYCQRTEWNVRDSDATLIIFTGRLTGGTLYTAQIVGDQVKPCYNIDLNVDEDCTPIRQWLICNDIGILNVAGPRESQSSGIYMKGCSILERLFSII